MLKCRDIVEEEASGYLDKDLPWRRHMGVAMHLLMCGKCRRFLRYFRLSVRLSIESLGKRTGAGLSRLEADRISGEAIARAMEN